jgi:hypothetical protein
MAVHNEPNAVNSVRPDADAAPGGREFHAAPPDSRPL